MLKNVLQYKKKGIALVISSPSGGGKSSLSNALIKMDGNIKLSVSVTTRAKLANEIDGKDYIFISKDEFYFKLNNNELFESAEIFGHFYGIPKKEILQELNQGQDLIFNVDWQGAKVLKKILSKYFVSVYILPPSLQELQNRLEKRNRDSQKMINLRMYQVEKEIMHCKEYDYVITNDDFNNALMKLQSILIAERLKIHNYE